MAVHHEVVRVTTTGNAGVATGSAKTRAIRGEILGVLLNFHASAPATTDTTIRTTITPTYTIVVATDSATDVFLTPRAKPVDNANAAITNAHAPFVVFDEVTVALAQCDALTDAVEAHIYWRD